MQIGIFETTFPRPDLATTLDAVAEKGIGAIQLNLASAGLESMPAVIPPEIAERIGRETRTRGIQVAAVSGMFNMIHPDVAVRDEGLRRLETIAAACAAIGTGTIGLCSGTRNQASMWRPHPENGAPEAWRDVVASMRSAAAIAERHNVVMAFEPEVANVIDSAPRARRLIEEIGSPRLKVVFDGANIYHRGELPRMRDILDEAFELLAGQIAFAHAKDLDRDGEAGHLAAGKGRLDYDHYLAGLRRAGFDGAIVLHGLTEAEVDGCLAFLREKVAAA